MHILPQAEASAINECHKQFSLPRGSWVQTLFVMGAELSLIGSWEVKS